MNIPFNVIEDIMKSFRLLVTYTGDVIYIAFIMISIKVVNELIEFFIERRLRRCIIDDLIFSKYASRTKFD